MPHTTPKEQSYLERITFDPTLTRGFAASYLGNLRVVLLSVIAILFLGIVSFLSLSRRLNPEINIPIISVATFLPGASPDDIESLVTIPLESELQNLSGIDTLTSVSRDNLSLISLQFLSTVAQEKAKTDVQSVVDSVTALPQDAQTPRVVAFDFEDIPVWTFALSGTDVSTLMRFSDDLKRKLTDTQKIDRVTLNGFETQEIAVTIDRQKVNQYGLNPLQLASTLKSAIVSYPGGAVETATNTYSLTIDPTVVSVEDIRKLKVQVSGQTVSLGDIATVRVRSKNNQRYSYLATKDTPEERVVVFNIFKTQTSNIDTAEIAARAVVEKELAPLKNRIRLTTVLNSADEINTQFYDLLGEFRSTILLIMACLFIFLGLRQALISSVTVPLTFLSAFVFMRLTGMSINFLSLFALLLTLGLLIDDTIVVVSAMTSYYKSGKFSPRETSLLVWRDTIVPIWSTTITTIWSFVPLLLSTGIIGEFIKPIPIVVSVTMISSTAISCLITLPFMAALMKPQIPRRVVILLKLLAFGVLLGFFAVLLGSNPLFPFILILYLAITFVFFKVGRLLAMRFESRVTQSPTLVALHQNANKYMNHGIIDIEHLSEKYYRLISRILSSPRARKMVLWGSIIYLIWAFALLPLGLVKNEFFPKEDTKSLFVSLELPPGTNLETTRTHSVALLDTLRSVPEAEFVALDVGRSIGDFGASEENTQSALFTLHLREKSVRKKTSIDLASELRDQFAHFSDGKVSVIEESGGPPAGADVQIQLLGDELGILSEYADQISGYLKKEPGVTNVEKSINPSTSKLVFIPDTAKVAQAGLSIDVIGLWLRTFASGFTLSEVNFDTRASSKTEINFSFDSERESPEDLGTLVIPTPAGGIPLLNVGTMVAKPNPAAITREDGKRTLSVAATVEQGYSVTDKNAALQKYADSLNLPAGYSWKTGGVNEENQKSVESILQAMGLSFLLILVTMVIQFRSYRQAIIVLLVIPLAISSVFVAFALTGTPLSFPALIGVLSLFGIVVTNSMFIVDKINLNLKERMPFVEAIADAGASRLEPIILTKLCTVLGLLPITLSNPLWRGLGGAIISGLLVSSTIMLLFIPVVYYYWFVGEQKAASIVKLRKS